MLIAKAFEKLLIEGETGEGQTGLPPGRPVIQMLEDGNWFLVPLEWNTAMKLVEIGVAGARIVNPDGTVLMTYPPVQEHA